IFGMSLPPSRILHFAIHIMIALVSYAGLLWKQSAAFTSPRIRFIAGLQLRSTKTCLACWRLSPTIDLGLPFFFMRCAPLCSRLLFSSKTFCGIFSLHGFPFIVRHQRCERQWGDELPQVLQN